jgi:hypothetical protein
MLSRTEFAHELSLTEEEGFLRFINYQLGVSAEVCFWIAVCEYKLIAVGLPASAID